MGECKLEWRYRIVILLCLYSIIPFNRLPHGIACLYISYTVYLGSPLESRITHICTPDYTRVGAQSFQLFATLWTIAHQAPLSMGFPRKEYWSGLPFSPSEDLLHSSIEASSPAFPALTKRFFTTEPPGKPYKPIFIS